MRAIRGVWMGLLLVGAVNVAQAASDVCWKGTVLSVVDEVGDHFFGRFAVVLSDGTAQKLGYSDFNPSSNSAVMYLALLRAQEKVGGTVEICGTPVDFSARQFKNVPGDVPAIVIRKTTFQTNGSVWTELAYH